MRRTIVPEIVGKRRRDGCQVPSGQTICGPGDAAARVRVHEADEDRRRRPSLGDRVGVREEDDSSPDVAAMPALTFAASGSGRGFSITRTSGGHGADRAGKVRDHDELVDLRHERGKRSLELGGVAVRDDDGGDAHRPSASR